MANQRKGTFDIDIIEKLKGSGIVTISDVETLGDLNIVQADVKCDAIIFNNCAIKGSLKFEKVNLKFGIHLINCEIERKLYFTELKATSFDSQLNYNDCTILIENSKIGDVVSVVSCELYYGIRFNNESEIGNVSISNNGFQQGGVSLRDITIKKSCDIIKNQMHAGIDIYGSTISSHTNIEMNKTTHLQFEKNRFIGNVSLNNEETQHLSFIDGVNEGYVTVSGLKINRNLNFRGNDFKNDVVISFVNPNGPFYVCDTVNIQSCSFGNGLAVYGLAVIGDENLNRIKTISINSTGKLSGDVLFRNFNVGLLEFKGINTKANIKILNICIERIVMEEFTNSSKVQFYNVKALDNTDSLFTVRNSNLGAFEFYDTYLNSFKNIHIKNSILSDVVVSNVKWFKQEQFEKETDYPESYKESYWSNYREVFRQLKYAMDKHGNRIQAIEFKSYEMDAYRRELKSQKLSWKNFANRFVLFLGWSNNHGTNWLKPALLIFVFTIFFYWLIVICISDKISCSRATSMSDVDVSLSEFGNYSSAIFKMINPVFYFDKVFKGAESKTFMTSVWEFLHRIVLAYLLFQMISAFRKFVK